MLPLQGGRHLRPQRHLIALNQQNSLPQSARNVARPFRLKGGAPDHVGKIRSLAEQRSHECKDTSYQCSQWQPSLSIILAGAVSMHAAISPVLLLWPPKSAAMPAEAGTATLQQLAVPMYDVSDAPDVHAQPEAPDQQQWWRQDQQVWQELTSPAELTAFLAASQPPPAWPALDSTALNPKLRLVEFYAGWCPACRAAAPGMAEVAGDPELRRHVTFARINIDRAKPLVRQLGITKIPTVLLLSPDGKTLDSFRASAQAARDALQLQLAALKQQQLSLPPAPVGPEEEPAPSEVGGEDGSSNGSSGVSGSSGNNGSSGDSSSSSTSDSISTPSTGTSTTSTSTSDSISIAQLPVDAALAAAKQQFMQQYGSGYGYGGWLEQHYEQEVGHRLGPGRHYLDYTGAALYPASLLQAVYDDLAAHSYGNPHSAALNISSASGSGSGSSEVLPPAAASEAVMEAAAAAVLSHLHADPAEYQVVFTRSATDALKLVGELFPWGGRSVGVGVTAQQPGSTPSELDMLTDSSTTQQQQQAGNTSEAAEVVQSSSTSSGNGSSSGSSASSSGSNNSSSRQGAFIYTRSNHNSVLGIGAYAAAAGTQLLPHSDDGMEAWVQSREQQQQQNGQQQSNGQQQAGQQPELGGGAVNGIEPVYNLLAYPAEDNFAGVVYPLRWINRVHATNSARERTLVLLDAAAYLPTHELNLSEHPADFVAASAYKMFGYPTGLGVLVLRTEHVPLLHKVYFGGGSVALATPEGCWHVGKCDPAAALSDGTPNYLGAAALKLAYESWDSRGGMQAVEQHTQALSSWLYGQLSGLRHSNGAPLLQLYGRHDLQNTTGLSQGAAGAGGFGQGAVFNFQVLQPDGQPVSFSKLDRDATAAGIYLRSGCVCNPGACYDAVGLQAAEVQALAGLKEGCGDEMDFATVMRPAQAAAATGSGSNSSGSAWWPWRTSASPRQRDSDRPAAELVPTQVPLGSVRASLGWASTFEDVYALVQFLKGYLS